jgi:hypothetical protein
MLLDGGVGLRLRRFPSLIALFGAALLGAVLFSSSAEAQCMPDMPATDTCNTVGADGKGILGGLILGAEIGFMTNALIVNAGVRELDEWWAWILFPAVLGAGGAVAGYFGFEDPNMGVGFPEAAVVFFAVSMALIVPTFVGVLALTAYAPGPDTEEDTQGATGEEDEEASEEIDEPINEASPEEPAPEETTPSEPAPDAQPTPDTEGAMRRIMAGGPGLLRFDQGRILIGMPMVHGADTFTAEERTHMRFNRLMDVRVPVVSGVF